MIAGGGGEPRTRVFIVGDTAVGAARVEAMLSADPRLDVRVLDASAMRTVEAEREPAIIILAMSSRMVRRVLDILRRGVPAPAVMVLASDPHEAWTARARNSGVRAVLPRDVTVAELSAAVAATRAGLLVLHPETLSGAKTASSRTLEAPGTLTTRELEVLEMIAEGMSNRAIATRLKISRHTVKFHVGAILTKLAARSRAEAVTVGVRQGLLAL